MLKNNKTIVIVDYGVGNTGTILNMVRKIGFNCLISNDITVLMSADKIILPGVGSFDQAMSNLETLNLIVPLNHIALTKKTDILGICLGMQIMLNCSDEGSIDGFGWIKGEVKRIDFLDGSRSVRLPHMGWSSVHSKHENSIIRPCSEEAYFYFLHSYHVMCESSKNIMGTSFYGSEFTSAIVHQNLYGVQFHPERSHRAGMSLLKDFIER